MKKNVVDDLGREISFNFPPKRIVSLVPSQTELLFDLGLDEEIVGLTKFCVHPIEKFATRAKVGGTKKIDIKAIIDLQPDLVIGNCEENLKTEIEELDKHFPVYISNVVDVATAMNSITNIGNLVNRAPEAAYLNHLILTGFSDLSVLAQQKGIAKRVAYIIWRQPYMAAGNGTFINDILQHIGLVNVVREERYPEIDGQELDHLQPDVIMLSSEPFPFAQKHMAEVQHYVPNAQIMLVDGEMFSWFGSRMVKAVGYLYQLLDELLD